MGSIHSVLKKKKGRLNTPAPSLISYTADNKNIASRRSVATKTYVKTYPLPVTRNRADSLDAQDTDYTGREDMKLSRSKSEKCPKKKQLHDDKKMADVDQLNKWFDKQSRSINLGTVDESSTDYDKITCPTAMQDNRENIYVNDIPTTTVKEMAESRREANSTVSNGVQQPRLNYTEVCFEKSPASTPKQRPKVTKTEQSVNYVDVRPSHRGRGLTECAKKTKDTQSDTTHEYQNVVMSTQQKTADQSTDKNNVVFRIQGFQEAEAKSNLQPSKGSDNSMSSKCGSNSKAQVELATGTRIVSLCSYEPPDHSVLGFKQHQHATLLSCSQEGWWYVCMEDSTRGWVPGNYWKEDKTSDVPSERCETPPKLEPRQAVVVATAHGGHQTDENEPWFMGRMSRSESEALLTNVAVVDDCFLVRESTNRDGDCTLSVRDGNHVRHFPIQRTPDHKYFIGKHHFRHLRTIVDYYSKHPLFFSDGQQKKVCLGQPVDRSARTSNAHEGKT